MKKINNKILLILISFSVLVISLIYFSDILLPEYRKIPNQGNPWSDNILNGYYWPYDSLNCFDSYDSVKYLREQELLDIINKKNAVSMSYINKSNNTVLIRINDISQWNSIQDVKKYQLLEKYQDFMQENNIGSIQSFYIYCPNKKVPTNFQIIAFVTSYTESNNKYNIHFDWKGKLVSVETK